MAMPQRLVQRVRLRAPTAALVRRGATLLEDALRTAATPLAGRLLVVRSLSVGIIRASGSSTVVSRVVEEKLRELATRAVHGGAADAAAAPAVFFRNETEALVLLATRIAGGETVDGWFWPIAVPHWRPGMSRDDALRAMAHTASADRAAPAPLAALVAALTERGRIDALLSVMQHSDAMDLMRGCPGSELARAIGAPVWRAPSAPLAPDATELPPDAARVLGRWSSRWGPTDLRTVWLAAMLLIGERRSLAAASDLARRVRSAIVVASGPSRPAPTTSERPRSAPASRSRLRDSEPDTPLPSSSDSAQGESLQQAGLPSDGAESASLKAGGVSPESVEHAPEPQTDDAPIARSRSPDHSIEGPRDAAAAAQGDTVGSTGAREASVERDERTTTTARGDAEVPAAAVADDTPRSGAPRPSVDEKPLTRARSGPRVAEGDVETRYAGLFFLIPAMMRLGMGSFLEAHPPLLAADFAAVMLRAVAQRLAIPADDPVWQVLDTPDRFPPRHWRGQFVVPNAWLAVAAPGPWLVRRNGKARALTDGSWQLVLARWHGRAPDATRALARGIDVRRGRPLTASPAALLRDCWRAALRRYCRFMGGIGLQALVTRPGRVAVARTHLDVIFGTRAVDIRIRRAGLDSNPQWLPWFGRVVQFHYDPGFGDAR